MGAAVHEAAEPGRGGLQEGAGADLCPAGAGRAGRWGDRGLVSRRVGQRLRDHQPHSARRVWRAGVLGGGYREPGIACRQAEAARRGGRASRSTWRRSSRRPRGTC